MAHLSREERIKIECYLGEGYNKSQIAQKINRNKSVITREFKRNMVQNPNFYSGAIAHKYAKDRQSATKIGKTRLVLLNDTQKEVFNQELIKRSSPEQIASVLRDENDFKVCANTIYKQIKIDRFNGGKLFKLLRNKGKPHKKAEKAAPAKISNKKSIEARPDKKLLLQEFGHWEIDTIFGWKQQSFLLTIVEMRSKFTIIIKLENKEAITTERAVLKFFKENPFYTVKSITSDNGGEFANHEKISQELSLDWYFCHPYSSWERGLNEGTNRLIRDFYPKGYDFRTASDLQIQEVQNILNTRVRKTLKFKRPSIVMCEMVAAA